MIVGLGPLALVAMFVVWSRLSDSSSTYYRGGSALFAVGVAVVISAAMVGGPVRSLLAFGPLPWIGRLSYGLYLWHWPIIVWLVPTRVPSARHTQPAPPRRHVRRRDRVLLPRGAADSGGVATASAALSRGSLRSA